MYQKHNSYINQKLRNNMMRLSRLSTMVADRGMNHSVCLEVRGKNQLMKELNECALASIVGGPDLAGKKKNRTYME